MEPSTPITMAQRPRIRFEPPTALLVLTLALTMGAAACSSTDGDSGGIGAQTEVLVVTTVAPITSIASSVIGDRATIVGLVPEGTNSHTFEPLPSAASVLARMAPPNTTPTLSPICG